jgi:hypothetical protein
LHLNAPGDPATIKLQFRWMPESKKHLNPRRAVEIEDNRQGLMQEIESYSRPADTPVSIRSGGRISIARSGSSRAVLSGDILNIEMPFEKALKMKKMMDLQWALISILALSGAAGAPELLNEPNPPNHSMLVHNWLGNVEAEVGPTQIPQLTTSLPLRPRQLTTGGGNRMSS